MRCSCIKRSNHFDRLIVVSLHLTSPRAHIAGSTYGRQDTEGAAYRSAGGVSLIESRGQESHGPANRPSQSARTTMNRATTATVLVGPNALLREGLISGKHDISDKQVTEAAAAAPVTNATLSASRRTERAQDPTQSAATASPKAAQTSPAERAGTPKLTFQKTLLRSSRNEQAVASASRPIPRLIGSASVSRPPGPQPALSERVIDTLVRSRPPGQYKIAPSARRCGA
jgi:hypothetical protein